MQRIDLGDYQEDDRADPKPQRRVLRVDAHPVYGLQQVPKLGEKGEENDVVRLPSCRCQELHGDLAALMEGVSWARGGDGGCSARRPQCKKP